MQWLYGSGFPKSHDVSKAIDQAAGAERREIARENNWGASRLADGKTGYGDYAGDWAITAPATAAAREWSGWGTALKPACEIICLARKPLSEDTIAANVLRHGVGALNIDACRVEFAGTNDAAAAAAAVGFAVSRSRGTATQSNSIGKESRNGTNTYDPFALKGRWPANILHDGSAEVLAGFPETASGLLQTHHQLRESDNVSMSGKNYARNPRQDSFGDSGSAARFFYTAKADSDDRLGSKHPTVKPLDLKQYLVRMICPRGGLVLDLFAGTGTTGEACIREGMRAILIEREAEYQGDIRRRMRLAMAGPDERTRESVKAKNLPRDDGPLFRSVNQSISQSGICRWTQRE